MSLDSIAALCSANSTDPNCVCVSGGGPEMNTDISGPGVRISFYLQALFLGVISTRSQSLGEKTSSLYMLICTNIALVITTFILGFRPEPEMSLHDAVIVFYLLGLSWITIFLTVPAYNRFRKKDKMLQGFYIFHSYLIFAFVLAVLIKAPTFGRTPLCNQNAVVVIFGDIPALSVGRIIACVFVALVVLVFSLLSVYDCKLPKQWGRVREWVTSRRREKKRERELEDDMSRTSQPVVRSALPRIPFPRSRTADPDGRSTCEATREKAEQRKSKESRNRNRYAAAMGSEQYLLDIDGRLIINLIIIVTLWAIFVMNSELAIVHNHFDGGSDGSGSDLWGFGQIFPMLITILPLVNLFQSFKELGLQKRRTKKRVHRCKPKRRRGGGSGEDLESGNGFSQEYGFSTSASHGYGHDFRNSYCPQRPHPAYGDRRRAWEDPARQPGARISQASLHSNDSSRYAEYAEAPRMGGRGDATPQSSSDSEGYQTADEDGN